MNRQQQIDAFLKAAHRLAVERLREQPQRASEVRAVITRWRERRGVTRSDAYLDEWERLLARPLDELARAVCADDDRAIALRSASPIAPLITAEERAALLRESRDA
jgi:hypothetical protein